MVSLPKSDATHRRMRQNISPLARPGPAAGPGGVIPAYAQARDVRGTKVYRVPQGPGEMMYAIAQRTMTNPQRWTEIYRLNPNLPPELPIPAGTSVVLPGDARVEQ